jgi:hypothetical protein
MATLCVPLHWNSHVPPAATRCRLASTASIEGSIEPHQFFKAQWSLCPPAVESYKVEQRMPLRGGAPSSTPDDAGDQASFGLFDIRRFRKYFNVDTDDVLVRMRDSVIGAFLCQSDFLEKNADNADL